MARTDRLYVMAKVSKVKRKPKDQYRHGNLKKSLLGAALSMIDQRGGVDFTIRELASKTGVTHAAAYRHFKSKNELMLEIAFEGFGMLNEYFRQSLSRDPADIVELGQSYVRFAIENPSYFRVMFHPDIKPTTALNQQQDPGMESFSILKKCVEANKLKNKFGDRSSDELSIAAWATVHGLSVLLVNNNIAGLPNDNRLQAAGLANVVAHILVEGLNKR